MAIRILLYISLMAAGWMLSSKGFIHNKIIEKISHLQTSMLFVLIFVMGISVGMNEQIISSIGKIGLTSAVYALFTTGFSIIFVYAARKKFFPDKSIFGGKND